MLDRVVGQDEKIERELVDVERLVVEGHKGRVARGERAAGGGTGAGAGAGRSQSERPRVPDQHDVTPGPSPAQPDASPGI